MYFDIIRGIEVNAPGMNPYIHINYDKSEPYYKFLTMTIYNGVGSSTIYLVSELKNRLLRLFKKGVPGDLATHSDGMNNIRNITLFSSRSGGIVKFLIKSDNVDIQLAISADYFDNLFAFYSKGITYKVDV